MIIYLSGSSKPALRQSNNTSAIMAALKEWFAFNSTMKPNFTACGVRFSDFSKDNSTYNFSGTPLGIFSDPSRKPPLITYEGCKLFCGSGTQYYAWSDISSTITTWVMMIAKPSHSKSLILYLQVFPVVGLLLQAPYESNKSWSTILALARWLGNPIAGMSYIFWNISVIGRCALMVDMATPYDEVPGPGSQFAKIRDSLYLLSVMNQCVYSKDVPSCRKLKLHDDQTRSKSDCLALMPPRSCFV